MPYIKLNDRPKFTKYILEAVDTIMNGPETPYVKGEYFGFWANRIAKEFVRDPGAKGSSFNSTTFNVAKAAKLQGCADKIAALIPSTDPIATSGDLNYVLSSVYWGILGDAQDIPAANYGFRTYLKGILGKIHDSIKSIGSGSQRDATMSFRRCIVAESVLDDVIVECYALKTRPYEDDKIIANDILWRAGKLVSPAAVEE